MSARANRINIDLGAYKQRWLDYCAAHHTTPSRAFKQVVAKLTAEEGEALAANAVAMAAGKLRKQVTLRQDEALFIASEARRIGLSESQWIVALVRAQMVAQPQLGKVELAALGQSNLALLAIGRNLNQIARACNGGRYPSDKELTRVLDALQVRLQQHVQQVAAVMAANLARWRRP